MASARTRRLSISCGLSSNFHAVRELLEENHPTLDVNAIGDDVVNPLFEACRRKSPDHLAIFKMLLAHPGINVNIQKQRDCYTPLHLSVITENVEVTSLLLKDPRVDINIGAGGVLPIHIAIDHAGIEIVKEFMRRRLDLNVEFIKMEFVDQPETELLLAYRKNRHLVQRQLLQETKECEDYKSTQLFLLSVLIGDGYYSINVTEEGHRFFSIMAKLPTEIQMLVAIMTGDKSLSFISSHQINSELKMLRDENFFV